LRGRGQKPGVVREQDNTWCQSVYVQVQPRVEDTKQRLYPNQTWTGRILVKMYSCPQKKSQCNITIIEKKKLKIHFCREEL